MSTPGRPAQDLNWLITNFVERVPDVAHAVVVSSDGLPLAFSAGFPQERADQLAAVTSGLASLTQGASRVFEGGMVVQTAVEMQAGVLLIMAVSHGEGEYFWSTAPPLSRVSAITCGVMITPPLALMSFTPSVPSDPVPVNTTAIAFPSCELARVRKK